MAGNLLPFFDDDTPPPSKRADDPGPPSTEPPAPVGLTITHGNITIALDEDKLVSLNRIWKDAGSPKNRDPRQWDRLPSSRDFVASLGQILNVEKSHIWKTRRGNILGGTWAHWKVAVEYAGYLDPALKSRVLDALKQWAEEEADPGLKIHRGVLAGKRRGWSDDHIQARVNGILKRNGLTDALKAAKVTTRGYATCTDGINRPILGGSAAEFKKKNSLPASAPTRDFVPPAQLIAIGFAEGMATTVIGQRGTEGDRDCADVCRRAGEAAAVAMRMMEV